MKAQYQIWFFAAFSCCPDRQTSQQKAAIPD
jgi:hypothetical protein